MTTSGITQYSVNELDIYKDALGNIGVYDPTQSLQAEDIVVCRRKLDMLIKQWVSSIDFASGIKMWTRRRGYMFLQDGQIEYDIGPGGDPTSDGEYVTTTMLVAGVATDLTIDVASITGIATTNAIGIELDSGTIQWTTVNGAPSSSTVTLTAALTAGAAIGNRVFVYTTLMRKPFEIEVCSLRDTDGNDFPVDVDMTLRQYEAIHSKSLESTPDRLYFEPRRTTSKVFLNYAPKDTTKVLRMVYLSYVEDLANNTYEVDFPAEWFRPLSAQLSLDLAPTYNQVVTPGLLAVRDDALSIARNAHPETTNVFFEYGGD